MRVKLGTLLVTIFLVFSGAALLGCQNTEDVYGVADVTVEEETFRTEQVCSGRFVSHTLPHITAANVDRIGFFISNGAGLAVNDLDNDGDMDLVLGNLLGENQIFWNEGEWVFRPEVLFLGSTRAVTTVDIDQDGWLDLVFTARNGDIRYWRNDGTGRFAQERLSGVTGFAYSLDWADLDRDGDLDLAAASYDASLEKQNPLYREADRAGVWVYINEDGHFSAERLHDQAQALATSIVDLNQDGQLDILVGNDFSVQDYVWYASNEGWKEASPFTTMSMSTMSFAFGDLDNDGSQEIFSADMHPYSDAPEVMAQWQPLMESMTYEMDGDDPQIMANVVNTIGVGRNGSRFADAAAQLGIAYTGWSWSGKFGDLNQDGLLDFYIVNGMQALDNFSHLTNDELVEENRAFTNTGAGFVLMNEWALNSTAGGRSMSMADFDGDGDLDIIVNNLGQASQLFENQLCQGRSLLVSLTDFSGQNRNAIGAKLRLVSKSGSYYREVRALSGYLSGDPHAVHFGFADGNELIELQITWPDGQQSVIASISPESHLMVTRSNER